jgi:3-oxoacyl-[acyl-carrier-protein] synthase I
MVARTRNRVPHSYPRGSDEIAAATPHMSKQPLCVLSTGMVTSVGSSSPASCAAMRAKLTNPKETRYMGSGGDWLLSHSVELASNATGIERLLEMAALAVTECIGGSTIDVTRVPLLVCLAEEARPGRIPGLNAEFITHIERILGATFSSCSSCISAGHVAIGIALAHSRTLLRREDVSQVLIVAADSFLSWPTICKLDQEGRILAGENSNGFLPGEGAAAVLIGPADNGLSIEGVGFGIESAIVGCDEPLRADGLVKAIRGALFEAECEMHELSFRITDIAGEQYHFKEASLAQLRLLRRRKEEFDLWHPAECIGEVGSVIGPLMLALADSACRKGYAPGPGVLIHCGNDAGERAAIIGRFIEA